MGLNLHDLEDHITKCNPRHRDICDLSVGRVLRIRARLNNGNGDINDSIFDSGRTLTVHLYKLTQGFIQFMNGTKPTQPPLSSSLLSVHQHANQNYCQKIQQSILLILRSPSHVEQI